MFRHTFATDLLSRGIPIEDVSALLGHRSVTDYRGVSLALGQGAAGSPRAAGARALALGRPERTTDRIPLRDLTPAPKSPRVSICGPFAGAAAAHLDDGLQLIGTKSDRDDSPRQRVTLGGELFARKQTTRSHTRPC